MQNRAIHHEEVILAFRGSQAFDAALEERRLLSGHARRTVAPFGQETAHQATASRFAAARFEGASFRTGIADDSEGRGLVVAG